MVSVDVLIAGDDVDEGLIPRPLSITHGRSGIGQQPDPPSTQFEWLHPVFPYQLGDDVQIWAGTEFQPATYDDPVATYDDPAAVYDSDASGSVTRPRFKGTIASVWANAYAGMVTGWTVTAVGYQARLGSTPVAVARPAESDVARVTAIAAAAGVTIATVGPPGVQLAAADIDIDALSALHSVCESTAGLLWQRPDGSLVYGTAGHRASLTDPAGLLPVEAVDSALLWQTAVEDIINQVIVAWGPPEAPSSATHNDLASQAKPWGVRSVAVATQCAAEADAEALALLILGRRANPYWGTPEAVLVAPPLDAEGARLAAALDVSTPVLVPFTSTPGPTPGGPSAATVEGWVETFDETEWTMQIALSDTARWVVIGIRTYSELAADFPTYADVAAAGSYLNALIEEG